MLDRKLTFSNRKEKDNECHCFAQVHSLKTGLTTFGKKGKDILCKKVKHRSDRTVWKPVHPSDLTTDEECKFMKNLIFLAAKIDGTTKGRVCASRITQRSCTPKEEASISKVTLVNSAND